VTGVAAGPAPSPGVVAAIAAADAPAPAAVELWGVGKRFPRRRPLWETLRRPLAREWVTALEGVSLQARAGECVGLLGPNGAGKSTLFRVLTTLVLPDAGRAAVGGADVVEDADVVRRIAASANPDERSLYWRLSARENLRLYASLRGLDGAERDGRVTEALAAVGLEDGDQLVGRLSTGLRQRLLIARALVGRPSVLLLDEPTRGLDPVAADRVRAFLRDEVVARRGCTVLIATHTAEEAFDLCDRVVVLHRGRVLAEGAARVLAARHVEDRYDLWLPGARAAGDVFRLLAPARPLATAPAEEPGWTRLRVRLPGGADAVAALVRRLAASEVPVARVEAVRPSLAELLAAITADGDRPAPPREARADA
jgi:ABC-2 type transport system ATP-binding protein